MNNLNQSWPQQPLNDLRVDTGFRENFSGRSLNAKLVGILPTGVYKGFDVIAGDGLNVTVGSAGVNSALIEVKDPVSSAVSASLTAAMPDGMQKTVAVPVGAIAYVVLKVFYRAVANMPESDKTAATIEVVTNLTEPDNTAYVVLATINAASDVTQINQSHITNVRKIDLDSDRATSFNALPIGPTNKTYTIAKGAGALAGEFSLFDTETGGFLKLVAIHTSGGKASISVTASSDNMPVTGVSIVQNGSDIELQATIAMNSPDAERIYTDFRAFDEHNSSSIGWVQSFVETVAGGTVLATVSTVFVSQGVDDKTVPEGLGSITSGNSGIVTEHNQPLAQRYLGLGDKASSAVTSDSSGTAVEAGNSAKLGNIPAAHIGYKTVDHNGPLKDLYVPLASDPNGLSVPFAVIKHANCPTGQRSYYVETLTYGSGAQTVRQQTATLVIETGASTFESGVTQGLNYRWLIGDPEDVGLLEISAWDAIYKNMPWQGNRNFGSDNLTIDTEDFLALLESYGAFNTGHWTSRGSGVFEQNAQLNTATSRIIYKENGDPWYSTPIGVGSLSLVGCLVEVYGTSKKFCHIRITTAANNPCLDESASSSEFVFSNNEYTSGDVDYSRWRRVATIGDGPHEVRDNEALDSMYGGVRSNFEVGSLMYGMPQYREGVEGTYTYQTQGLRYQYGEKMKVGVDNGGGGILVIVPISDFASSQYKSDYNHATDGTWVCLGYHAGLNATTLWQRDS